MYLTYFCLLIDDCEHGASDWIQHGSDDVTTDPSHYMDKIFELSQEMVTITEDRKEVCFHIRGVYVILYTIHFWAAGVESVRVYTQGATVEVCVCVCVCIYIYIYINVCMIYQVYNDNNNNNNVLFQTYVKYI